jgi:hypothetical protein
MISVHIRKTARRLCGKIRFGATAPWLAPSEVTMTSFALVMPAAAGCWCHLHPRPTEPFPADIDRHDFAIKQ